MFFPPYDAILASIGTTREKVATETHVRIPVSLLKFFLKRLLDTCDFDAETYLTANPDVAEAVRNHKLSSPLAHYVNYGFWEGRGGAVVVDEAWYLKKNPDVATAVRGRRLKSGQEHYNLGGAGELRSPSMGQEKEVKEWATALGRPI